MAFVTAAPIIVHRPRAVNSNTGRIPPAADEITVGRHLHRPIAVGTRHAADAMIAGPHRHLPLTETQRRLKWLWP